MNLDEQLVIDQLYAFMSDMHQWEAAAHQKALANDGSWSDPRPLQKIYLVYLTQRQRKYGLLVESSAGLRVAQSVIRLSTTLKLNQSAM